MANDTATGNTPVVDGSGVRFTLFHQTRGPVVYEIPSQVLQSTFHARGTSPDDLLDAYSAGQARIHEVAAGTVGRTEPIILGSSDFARVQPGHENQ